MRYYIADPHFFHEKLNTNMDCRGFGSAEEMNAYMVEKWNTKVRNNDEVVILGDLTWGKPNETNELLQKLHGRLYLIEGNHDKILKKKGYDTSRFVWIKPYAEQKDHKRKIVLSHYPILCYNGQYRLDENGNPKTYMLYGHVHNTYDQRLIEQFQATVKNRIHKTDHGEIRSIPSNMINCFCMYADYTPLTLDEWIICDRTRREKQCVEDSM